jgi:hypothetical protein
VKRAASKPHHRQSAALRVENRRLLEEVRRLRQQRGESIPPSAAARVKTPAGPSN